MFKRQKKNTENNTNSQSVHGDTNRKLGALDDHYYFKKI